MYFHEGGKEVFFGSFVYLFSSRILTMLINILVMKELEINHFAKTITITDSGKNQQWRSNSLLWTGSL